MGSEIFRSFLAISNEVLADSTRKSEKAAFARQLLMSALNILVRECQKEERTKQGGLSISYGSTDAFNIGP